MARVVMRLIQAAVVCALIVMAVSLVRALAGGKAGNDGGRQSHSGGRDLVLGPTGIGKLRLGMSERQAAATGEATMSEDWRSSSSKCGIQTVNGVNIHFSRHHGLAVLSGPEGTRTPEGIRDGASVAQIAAAYPTLTHPDLGTPQEQVRLIGYLAAPVPQNPDAVYLFVFGIGGTSPETATVRLVLLALRNQDEECTGAG
jgi:hypothetical protein